MLDAEYVGTVDSSHRSRLRFPFNSSDTDAFWIEERSCTGFATNPMTEFYSNGVCIR